MDRVEAISGQLLLSSHPGRGTLLVVDIPLAVEPPPQPG
jgi:signal transduction histidine kinase